MGSKVQVIPHGMTVEEFMEKGSSIRNSSADMNSLTSADYYADSYGHFGIHEEMLKDTVRTTSYRNAIYQNAHLFANKVVLDVGCGTGILSMFCVKAGAKHVIGVDMSNIIDHARKIVELNGMGEKITLLKGKMEEVNLPFKQVDIIVSEWMGYFLLYESMLDTVLWARDRYLKPGGLIFPDRAQLFVAGIEDADYKEEKIGFWKSVYGFDFSPIADIALREPLVDTVDFKALVTDPYKILDLNLNTCTVNDLKFTSNFRLRATREDFIHAIIAWFDIGFEACHKPVRFSTGPQAKYTHWKQTVFYTQDTIIIEHDEVIEGRLACVPNAKNRRDLDIAIWYRFNGRQQTLDSGSGDGFIPNFYSMYLPYFPSRFEAYV